VLALARDLGIPRVGIIANKIRVEREVSDVATFAARHHEAITRDPVWPISGWTLRHGITEQRRTAQRDALADRCGYLESPG